jgi:hypothetical protein
MITNPGNRRNLASRAWKAVLGASFVSAALVAGCSAGAPGDEAAAETSSAVGACPGTDVLGCYFEPGTHIKTCDCYPAPSPTCS